MFFKENIKYKDNKDFHVNLSRSIQPTKGF